MLYQNVFNSNSQLVVVATGVNSSNSWQFSKECPAAAVHPKSIKN